MFLTNIMDIDVGNIAHKLQQIAFTGLFQMLFQSRSRIKVVLYGPFSMAADDKDFFNTAGQSFFHYILNSRFIDNGQHFFRRRLRSR